ncbi:HD-GYP domain-containing protein [Arcobacter sp. YIC-464]|uniref:HD-GYP domain-containing protein n=1 Tax=Arcobacter sp. YIC-464 TaxID=3376631 RepID=UPI003C1A46F8
MNKKTQIVFNLNNFLLSISNALDYKAKEYLNTSLGHSKRVAYISLKIANELNLSNEDKFDLCAYSLCANLGLYESKSISKEFCELSQEYCDKLPFQNQKNYILKYSHEKIDGSGVFGLKNDEIPLFSQILSFANLLDINFDLSNNSLENIKKINEFIKTNSGVLFKEEFANYFLKYSANTSFWLDLQNENEILFFIFSNLLDYSKVLNFDELLDITCIFDKIDSKNSELLVILEKVVDYYGFEYKDKMTLLITASLSKLGKFTIPSSILNKKNRLEDYEYELVKSYPYYNKKFLSNIIGFNDISIWASKVQETLDGKGYPYSFEAKDLSLKERVLSCAIIYSSLIANKPYREAYSHNKTIEIMKGMASNNKIDLTVVKDFENILE